MFKNSYFSFKIWLYHHYSQKDLPFYLVECHPYFASIVTSMFLLIGCFKLILIYFIYTPFTATDCEPLEVGDSDLIFHGTPKADKE